MGIGRFLPHTIKYNPTLAALHRKIRFLESIPPKDYVSFKKLILFKKVYPYTMIGYKRLSNVYMLSQDIEHSGRKGAFVECGVWKGGAAGVMAFLAQQAKSERKIWLFDSFEGLPEPTTQDGLKAETYADGKISGALSSIEQCVAPLEDVERLFFSILHIDRNNIVIKKGWFQDTLPEAKKDIGSIAILRLDGDWYESTKCCLENLYDNVVSGGYIIVDDYWFWEGCRKAVDDFLSERNISVDMISIDKEGAYFQKQS